MADSSSGRDSQKLPNQLISATGMGLIINAALSCNQTVNIPKNSTLNEKYNILADESLGRKKGRDFELGYFGVGIGGSRSTGQDSFGLEGRRVHQHTAVDFNAFFPIPMVIRKLGDDLDPEVRKYYRVREIRKIGDDIHILYWLKKAGFTEFDPTMKVGTRDPETGNEKEREYVPRESDLSPVPNQLVATNNVPITDTFINGTGKIDMSLNSNDLEELRNVCRIMFNDEGKAAINEVYMCYGIETENDGQVSDGATTPYQELVSCAVAFHITEAYARDANANNKMPWFFWYGNSLPLLVAADALVASTVNAS